MIFSFTLIDTFHNVCPRQAYERWWNKIKVPASPEMAAGQADHKALEKRVQFGHQLPDHLWDCEKLIEPLMERGVPLVERKMGVTRDLAFTGFFDNDCYIRSVADIALYTRDNSSCFVGDWKTGKPKEDRDPLQLKILSATVFSEYPQLQTVAAANMYTKTATLGTMHVWKRSELPGLWRDIVPLIQEIEAAEARKHFPERQGPLCGWCPVFKCQHNKNPQKG